MKGESRAPYGNRCLGWAEGKYSPALEVCEDDQPVSAEPAECDIYRSGLVCVNLFRVAFG